MYKTILVPLDGSSFSERALPMATSLARATGACVALVRVAWTSVPAGIEPGQAQVQAMDESKTYLTSIAGRVAAEGIPVTIAARCGLPADGILDEIDLCRPDLVVMCTHGRSGLGRWIYGSVAEAVLARSTAPVVFVRATGALAALPPALDRPRLLVPLDGSSFAEAALHPAQALAHALDGTVSLLRVVAPPATVPSLLVVSVSQPLTAQRYIEEALKHDVAEAENYLAGVAARLMKEDLRVQTTVRYGLPAELILEAARAEGTGLIAMATHGRTGLGRLLMGSVALEVLQRGVTPLLLVHPTGLDGSSSDRRA